MELSPKQLICVKRALEGHSFTIIGKSGTGKSFVTKEIMRSFVSVGKKFQLVCSTGISCEVYTNQEWPLSNATVLNLFFNIGIATGPFYKIVEEAVKKCSSRLLELHCVLWDEFSMNSSRDLELIHCICSKVRGNNLPFGGIQFILIGDWRLATTISSTRQHKCKKRSCQNVQFAFVSGFTWTFN